MITDLNDKIWITGASSGIGRSMAISFANAGYKVFATARRKEKLELLSNELREGAVVKSFPLDITDSKDVFSFAETTFGDDGIDCLINNAGITSFSKIENNLVDDIEKIIQTNLLGSIYAIKAVLPSMIMRKKGTIINILSVVTEKIFLQSGVYSASKAGLKAFALVLREEVRDKNIRVINIYPGATETDIWSERSREKYAHRMMNPKDVADFVLSVYEQTGNLVTEEIVLKPILGDL
ncbi:MAG: SDR family oxidoreductase [Ignavibacteriaceae bacterium]